MATLISSMRIRCVLVLITLAASLICRDHTPRRRYEACLWVQASIGDVEALHTEVLARSTPYVAPVTVDAAVPSEQGGHMASYGEHWMGVQSFPDPYAKGQLQVWGWSSRHPMDAHAVIESLANVLAEHSIEFTRRGR